MSRFDYVKYDEEATRQQENFKTVVVGLEHMINEFIGKGRASSLAITKLEECYMWIGKQIRDDQVGRKSQTDHVPERSDG